ncbi:ATP-binding protein [Actimicrobium sp. CCC2.4]|uniref:ATP-binding protein n=1 Tax=Actimicrobium sp. CCC2.4 TaxID=3048606 RepID=UPI002B24A6EB|nr:ATP-binding protein [Actimicrobium sp. CCC2.4]MEB0136673.1 ATP-binding protein [Actimicrobium sp. CCC2.4]
MPTAAPQRIIKIRRDYNTLVANETLEDYALRFTPRAFRKWSEFSLANTAMGAVSFLALEAIGGAITLSYGFSNAFWAILCVSVLIFLTGLPISYYAAKYGVDMDLLTRGAGFGYIGSTITSLIYASFTFIFFALEASIMAQAVQLYAGLPLALGYIACSLVIIPMVAWGITWISRLQLWTQPIWIVLLVLPYACVLYKEPTALNDLMHFSGRAEDGGSFNLTLFGAAAAVAFALIAQIGEQVDFLRFLPEKTAVNRVRWWSALLLAGPGWVVLGAAKMLGGALLAFLAIQHQVPMDQAIEPTRMYLVGFGYVFSNPAWILAAVTLFVVVSQVKINVTNAYAGSLAWSNFFARLTHSHPGRVVWLVFNVLIAILLMELGVFAALEHVLGIYSLVPISWIGAVVADLVINKPLGLSPPHIEFKRAHLYDINPVGVGAMLGATLLSALAMAGLFGGLPQALAPFIALGSALLLAPLIALATRGRYYLARADTLPRDGLVTRRCVVCENTFETEDMAHCPAYQGAICSLCCTLDVRCNDRCKVAARLPEQLMAVLPAKLADRLQTRLSRYLIVLVLLGSGLALLLWLLYAQEQTTLSSIAGQDKLGWIFVKLFFSLMLLTGVGVWWLVLTADSRRIAHEESDRQTRLLLQEIAAHEKTDAELQRAKEAAESANLAKTRFITGMSHELRTPLNSILGYAQILQFDPAMPPHRKDAIDVIHRSGNHLLSLIDGLLDIAKIEAGKMRLDTDELALPAFLEQIVQMFAPLAAEKGLAFAFVCNDRVPDVVRADHKRVRQILINLLGNALKFTDTGAVTLRLNYGRDMAHFSIEDTGIGMTADEAERIFYPFERTVSADLRAAAGTGLGLTISNMLTHIMGGELTVTSTPGRGSCFLLKLYLPTVHAPRAALTLVDPLSGYTGTRRRILIVDDQPGQRTMLAQMLLPMGFAITEAGSGAACLASIRAAPPDLVLLDIAMPEMDGWAVSRAIRALPGTATLPLLIVSANAFDLAAGRAGFPCHDGFIVKPVSLLELLAKIKLHLKLDWIAMPLPAVLPGAPATRPPPEELAALLELGAIGYVKGILAKLTELEQHTPSQLAFTTELRELVRRFRLNDFAARLKEAIHDAPPAL